MAKLYLQKIEEDGESELKQFYAARPTEGNIHFTLQREPNFFEALDVEGYTPKVMAVINSANNEIACSAIRTKRMCYINGKAVQIGYLSGLRLVNKYKSGTALPRIFNYLKENQSSENCALYFCSIFDDNTHAIKVLTSGKAGIPMFRKFGQFRTFIFKPSTVKIPGNLQVEIRKANKEDIDKMLDFLNKEGSAFQLFPVYERKDFINKTGIFKKSQLNDIAIACINGEIIGTMALLNQSAFRQWKIQHYSNSFKLLKPFINFGARISGKPVFPKEGESINYRILSLICIKNFDAEIFQRLLNFLTTSLTGSTYIFAGFFEQNPLIHSLNFPVVVLKSQIYTVHCTEESKQIKYNQTIPHIELASL